MALITEDVVRALPASMRVRGSLYANDDALVRQARAERALVCEGAAHGRGL